MVKFRFRQKPQPTQPFKYNTHSCFSRPNFFFFVSVSHPPAVDLNTEEYLKKNRWKKQRIGRVQNSTRNSIIRIINRILLFGKHRKPIVYMPENDLKKNKNTNIIENAFIFLCYAFRYLIGANNIIPYIIVIARRWRFYRYLLPIFFFWCFPSNGQFIY